MLAGAARGVFTLLQATAVSDRWGAAHYGRLNGLLSAPALLATALAPWAGAALAHSLGSYPAVFWVLGRDRSAGRSPRHRFHTGSETERALTSAHRRRRIHPTSTGTEKRDLRSADRS